MKVAVLLSGGLDSSVLLHHMHAEHEVTAALTFDYGSKHNPREIACARWQAERLGVRFELIELPFVGRTFVSHLLSNDPRPVPKGHYQESTMRQTVVPFRNAIMLSIATGYAESCGAEGLAIAAHTGDHAIYPDCREDFMRAMESAIELGTYARIKLLRPFIEMDKAAIVRRGAELGVDFTRTYSCYAGCAVHCGECGTCVERREAFLLAGVPDPTTYLQTLPLPPKPGMR